MKKILYSILLIMIFMVPSIVIAAGSASGSVPGTVEKGSNVTFTVKMSNAAAWNLKLSGSGSTSGCSQAYADATDDANNTTKNFTVTCNATNVGTITFTATGDITSADGVNSNVSITKTVNVVLPREKDKETRLSTLTIDNYKIDFNKDKETYSINVDPSVNSINISAAALSPKATVSGTGRKELSLDGGKYEVVCTSEAGTKKIYTINVSVVDNNPIKVKIDDVEYTIVKTAKLLKTPTNTIASKVKIQNIDVPAYVNEQSKITIVGVKDNSGNIKYSIYDNGEYKLYNENKSSELLLYISSKKIDGYNETKVTINEKEYTAYEVNDRFKLVYAMNLATGEYNYYKYDTKEKTFQHFDEKADVNNNVDNNKKNDEKDKSNGFNVFLVTTILFAVATLSLVVYVILLKKNVNLKSSESTVVATTNNNIDIDSTNNINNTNTTNNNINNTNNDINNVK